MQWKRFGGAFIVQAAFEGWLTKLSSKLGVVCAASDEWAVEAVSRFFSGGVGKRCPLAAGTALALALVAPPGKLTPSECEKMQQLGKGHSSACVIAETLPALCCLQSTQQQKRRGSTARRV